MTIALIRQSKAKLATLRLPKGQLWDSNALMENPDTQAARYNRAAVILHWLIAVLILLNIIGAFVSEDLPKPDRMAIMALHKAAGIILLLLTFARIGWRLRHRPPPLVATLKAWEIMLTRGVHFMFYLLMVALPLSGWAMVSSASQGKGVGMFGLFDVPALPVGYDKPTLGLFHEMHEVMGFMMIALFVLHLAGALKHQLLDKDGTMRRIAPWMP